MVTYAKHSCDANLDAVCRPLTKIGINFFSFMRNYFEGKQLYISNNLNWITDYYNKQLYMQSLFEYSPTIYNTCYYLIPNNHMNKVCYYARKEYDSIDCFVIIKKYSTNTSFYFFSDISRKNLTNIYFNNIDYLNNFVRHFNYMVDVVLENNPQNCRILNRSFKTINKLSENTELARIITLDSTLNSNHNAMDKASNNKYYTFDDKIIGEIVFTSKEFFCAKELIKGKTAKEIGLSCFRSERTVEKHIANIRQKLFCKNKSETIRKLLILGLTPSDEG